MEYRKELLLDNKTLAKLEDVDFLTTSEYKAKYGVEAIPSVFTIDFNVEGKIRQAVLEVSPGNAKCKGTTVAKLRTERGTSQSAWPFGKEGKLTGEYRFEQGEDIYVLDVKTKEKQPRYKAVRFIDNQMLRDNQGCVVVTLQKKDGSERDVFWSLSGKEMKEIYEIAQNRIRLEEDFVRTGRGKFGFVSVNEKLACIQEYIDKEQSKGHEVVTVAKTSLKELSPAFQAFYVESALAKDFANMTSDELDMVSNIESFENRFSRLANASFKEGIETIKTESANKGLSIDLLEEDEVSIPYMPIWVQEMIERPASLTKVGKDLLKMSGTLVDLELNEYMNKVVNVHGHTGYQLADDISALKLTKKQYHDFVRVSAESSRQLRDAKRMLEHVLGSKERFDKKVEELGLNDSLNPKKPAYEMFLENGLSIDTPLIVSGVDKHDMYHICEYTPVGNMPGLFVAEEYTRNADMKGPIFKHRYLHFLSAESLENVGVKVVPSQEILFKQDNRDGSTVVLEKKDLLEKAKPIGKTSPLKLKTAKKDKEFEEFRGSF